MALSKDREQNLQKALTVAMGENPNASASELVQHVEEIISKGIPEPDDAICGTVPEEITLSEDLRKFITERVNAEAERRSEENRVASLVDQRLEKYAASRPRNIAFPGAHEPANRGGGNFEDFSLSKYIRGITKGIWVNADKEHEYLQKALSGDVGASGGFGVPDPVSDQVIDLLYEQSVLPMAGVTPIPIGRTQNMPIMAAGTSVSYGHKEGATITTSTTPTLGMRSLVCRDATCLIPIPNELIEDSSVKIEQMVRGNIAREMALDKDAKAFVGNGDEEPMGIWNQGIGKESNVALTSLTLTHIRAVFLAIRVAKSKAKAIFTHPAVTDRLMGLEDSQGRNIVNPDPKNADILRLGGIPIYDSVNIDVSTGTTGYPFIAGDFAAEILLGENGGIRIDADASVGFKENVTWIRAIHRWDIKVAHLPAIHGILATY